jgi:hypothetical protein
VRRDARAAPRSAPRRARPAPPTPCLRGARGALDARLSPPTRLRRAVLPAASKQYSEAERTLTSAVVDVNSHEGMANNPNIKFRSFVCCGLNNGLLHEWVRVLTEDEETMTKFYEAWAFVRATEGALTQIMDTLQPLGSYKYSLSLDYELTRWDLV